MPCARRLDAFERAENERAERIAAKRLHTQAARERRKLLDRERAAGLSASDRLNADSGSQAGGRLPRERALVHDPYLEWLDTRKNLSGRALAEASGLSMSAIPQAPSANGVNARRSTPSSKPAGCSPDAAV
jgi:hypothetical protein